MIKQLLLSFVFITSLSAYDWGLIDTKFYEIDAWGSTTSPPPVFSAFGKYHKITTYEGYNDKSSSNYDPNYLFRFATNLNQNPITNAEMYYIYRIDQGTDSGGDPKIEYFYRRYDQIEITLEEYNTYIPHTCTDGGSALEVDGFYTCDRKCSSVNMLEVLVDDDNNLATTPIVNCIDRIDCNTKESDCVLKCGGIENILNYSCNDLLNNSSCVCKSATIDSIIDDSIADSIENYTSGAEIVDPSSTLVTNDILSKNNDAVLKTNELLSNQNDLLSSINNKNTDSLLQDILDKDSITDNTVLEGKIDLLGDTVQGGIDDTNVFLDWFMSSTNNLADSLNNSDYGGSIASTISSNNDGSSLDNLGLDATVSNVIGDSFSNYTSALGFNTDYGVIPENVTFEMDDNLYTVLDYTVLDSYIEYIRSLFISIAYISGFMFLLRKD